MDVHSGQLASKEANSCERIDVTDLTALYTDLIRTETRVFNRIDARLRAEHDLTLGQLEFLRILAAHGTCRVYDIARQVDITVGATSPTRRTAARR